jgi:GTP-binding protein
LKTRDWYWYSCTCSVLLVADIPGLIEDAHRNRGLGISFLRHIERCVCLVYVIDLASEEPWSQLQVLYDELDHYNPDLRKRPSIVLGNKMDLEEGKRNLGEFRRRVGESGVVIPVSAKEGINLKALLSHIRIFYDAESEKLRKKYTEPKASQEQINLEAWTRAESPAVK